MPLPVPKLDSRGWEELVAEGRSLLPRVAPEWTDHNLHDPGITLLELFAWLTELLLYRSDRVTPAMQRVFLRLVGIVPRPPLAAETVVTVAGVAAVASGTRVLDTAGAALFETTHDLTPSAARLVAVAVESDGVRADRTADNGRGFPPFGPTPSPGDALLLGFDAVPARSGAELSLYVWTTTWIDDARERERLAAEARALAARCAPEPAGSWRTREACAKREPSATPADAGPPAWWRHYAVRTVWEHQDGTGWTELAAEDETRAFALSGAVRLTGPAAHLPDPVTGRWWIRCRLATGRYECPPRVLAVAANAVAARHAVAAGPEPLGTTRGEPYRSARLRRRPVLAGSTSLRLTLPSGAVEDDWSEVLEWDAVAPDDRCYRLDPLSGTIELGNGRRGLVPATGAVIEATAYQTGGGAGGNVRAGTLVGADGLAAATVEQPYAAIGGADAEPLLRAHGRALDELAVSARAITLADLERLALETPGVPVGRARAIPAYHPGFPSLSASGCVTVVVLPRCGVPPGDEFVAAVRRHLEPRRPLTVELHVVGPEFEPVEARATLVVTQRARLAEAEAALRAFFDPIAGGPEGGGWPFGRDVLESEVMSVLAGVEGVVYVDDLVLGRAGADASCGNLALCAAALVHLHAVTLTVTEEKRP